MLVEEKDTALSGLEAEEARLARVRDALFAVEAAQRNLDDAEKSYEKKEKGKKDKQLLDDARRLLSNEQARLSAAIGVLEVRELADLQAVCTLGGSPMDFASARALARGAWADLSRGLSREKIAEGLSKPGKTRRRLCRGFLRLDRQERFTAELFGFKPRPFARHVVAAARPPIALREPGLETVAALSCLADRADERLSAWSKYDMYVWDRSELEPARPRKEEEQPTAAAEQAREQLATAAADLRSALSQLPAEEFAWVLDELRFYAFGAKPASSCFMEGPAFADFEDAEDREAVATAYVSEGGALTCLAGALSSVELRSEETKPCDMDGGCARGKLENDESIPW